MNNVIPISTNVVKILKKAKEKISKPEQWIRGTFARDKNGNAVGHGMPAHYYDIVGAVKSLSNKYNKNSIKIALLFLSNQMKIINPSFDNLSDFNDDKNTHHELVIHLFNLSITEAENWKI